MRRFRDIVEDIKVIRRIEIPIHTGGSRYNN